MECCPRSVTPRAGAMTLQRKSSLEGPPWVSEGGQASERIRGMGHSQRKNRAELASIRNHTRPVLMVIRKAAEHEKMGLA